jgi:hypothetical protein
MVCEITAVNLITTQAAVGKRHIHFEFGVFAGLALVSTSALNTAYFCQHTWLRRRDQDAKCYHIE